MSRRRERYLELLLDNERVRVEQLLQLLMANATPANFYAQNTPAAGDPPQWLFDETGLNSVPYYDEDDVNDVPTR